MGQQTDTQQRHRRNEFIAALSLLHDGEKAADLFRFASAEDETDLSRIAGSLSAKGDDPSEILRRLSKAHQATRISGLDLAHPAWILEKLEGESPLVLGVLCRFLSGDKVKYILQHLPEPSRRQLPRVIESYRVLPQIAEIVRERAARRFAYELPEGFGGRFDLPHLTLVKPDDLKMIFRDLGLEEIRKAFRDSDPHVLKAFLARFTPKLAREIRDRIEFGGPVLPNVRQEAQKHLVTLPLEKLPVEELFSEIGYSSFARSLTREDLAWAEVVYQKLPLDEGHRLKRILRETVVGASSPESQKRREAVLSRIRHLGEKGLIRRYWKAA